jgi:hypothetical protein
MAIKTCACSEHAFSGKFWEDSLPRKLPVPWSEADGLNMACLYVSLPCGKGRDREGA